MKICVTGGLGFIGSHLVRSLLQDDNDITIIDDCSAGILRSSVQDILRESEFIRADLSWLKLDQSGTFAAKALEKADLVYHLASIIGSKHIQNAPYKMITANTMMARNVIEFTNCPIIFTSSVEVMYGMNWTHESLTEDMALHFSRPFSSRWVYAMSKHFCEQLFWHGTQERVAIARLANTYGPDMCQDYVIKSFMEKLKDNPAQIDIYSPYDTREFTYIDDTVNGLRLLDPNSESGGGLQSIYNIGTPFAINIIDVARIIKQAFDVRTALCIKPPIECEKRHTSFASMEKAFGYRALIPLKEGIDKIISWEAGQ